MREDPPRDGFHPRRDRFRHFQALHELSRVLVHQSIEMRARAQELLAQNRALRRWISQTGPGASPPSPREPEPSEHR